MSAVLITGGSGAGKTTIAAALAARGREAIDADDDPLLARFAGHDGSVVERPPDPDLEWIERHGWEWEPARLDDLIAAAAPAMLFACGHAANELQLAARFAHIIVLELDEPTMIARLDAPGRENDWGRAGDTRQFELRWLRGYQQRMREFGAIPVDARQPLDQVIAAILAVTG